MVQGRVVVDGGEVITVDERAARAELAERLDEIIERQDRLDERNQAVMPGLARMYERATSTPGAVNRFSGDERAWLV